MKPQYEKAVKPKYETRKKDERKTKGGRNKGNSGR